MLRFLPQLLLKQFGPSRILWGTDSTWYGSPQSLIDAFRAFTPSPPPCKKSLVIPH